MLQVIDGDTIEVRTGGRTETVRLLGIDTPETAGSPRPAECFGERAAARTAELLPKDSLVRLTRDQQTRDQFGRLLAFVHRTDGLFVNLELLEQGHAVPLFIAPNDAAEVTFEAAADRARRRWVGFWPACGAADVVLDASASEPPARQPAGPSATGGS